MRTIMLSAVFLGSLSGAVVAADKVFTGVPAFKRRHPVRE
jgi:hypothetical protein